MIGELIRNNPNERKKNYSIIHWETGEPKESGCYLCSSRDGMIVVDKFDCIEGWAYWQDGITAWCKLSDIKPYKEEKK